MLAGIEYCSLAYRAAHLNTAHALLILLNDEFGNIVQELRVTNGFGGIVLRYLHRSSLCLPSYVCGPHIQYSIINHLIVVTWRILYVRHPKHKGVSGWGLVEHTSFSSVSQFATSPIDHHVTVQN